MSANHDRSDLRALRPFRQVFAFAALPAIVAVVGLVAAAPAFAALTVSFQPLGSGPSDTQTGGFVAPGLSQPGTPAFCSADPGGGNYIPGCDFSNTDNIVRTHDNILYQININSSGGDPNPVVTIRLPSDTTNPYATPGYVPPAYTSPTFNYDQSPDQTGNQIALFAGTTFFPADGNYLLTTPVNLRPDPTTGLVAGSSTASICPGPTTKFDATKMTLTCDLTGAPNTGSGNYSYTFPLTLQVMGSARNSVKNGDVSTLPASGCLGVGIPVPACTGPDIILTAYATGDSGVSPTVTSFPIHVSATPRFNIEKHPSPNVPSFFGNFGPNGEAGWVIQYHVDLATDAWLGSEALAPATSYSLADSLSVPAPVNPQNLQWENYASSFSGILRQPAGTGGTNTGCYQGTAFNDWGPVANNLANLGTFWGNLALSLGNGGACDLSNFQKSGTSGGSLTNTYTISAPDTRLDWSGRFFGWSGGPAQGNPGFASAYASAKQVAYFIPATEATWNTPNHCVTFTNSVTTPSPELISISGQTNVESISGNETASIDVCAVPGGPGSAGKQFVSYGFAPDYAQPVYYNPSAATPVIQATPGQLVASRIVAGPAANTGTTGQQISVFTCDIVDSSIYTVQYLATPNGGPNGTLKLPSVQSPTPSLDGSQPYLQVGVASAITPMNQAYFTASGSAFYWTNTSLAAGTGATGSNSLCDPLNDTQSGITWYNVTNGANVSDAVSTNGLPGSVPAAKVNQIVLSRYITAPTTGGAVIQGIDTVMKVNAAFAWPYNDGTNTHAAGESMLSLAPGTPLPNHSMYGANTAPNGSDTSTMAPYQAYSRGYAQLGIASPDVNAQVSKTPNGQSPACTALGCLINYTVAPIVSTDNVTFPVQAMITDVLDPNQNYVPNSASGTYGGVAIGEPAINSLAGGYTQLTWTINVVPTYWPTALPTFSYQATLASTLTSGTVITNDVKVDAPFNTNGQGGRCTVFSPTLGWTLDSNGAGAGGGCYSSARVINTFVAGSGIRASKTTSTPVIPRNGLIQYQMTYLQDSTAVDTSVQLIDILPWNGDGVGNTQADPTQNALNQNARVPATSYTGMSVLQLPVLPPSNDTAQPPLVLYTSAAPGTINNDPFDPGNNGATATTTWCTFGGTNTWTPFYGTGACPTGDTTSNNVSAIRLINVAAEKGTLYAMNISFQTNGNSFDNVYTNQFCLNTSGGTLICPLVAVAGVGPAAIEGVVYADDNNNGVQDPAETGIPNTLLHLFCQNTTPPGGNTDYYAFSAADGTYAFKKGATVWPGPQSPTPGSAPASPSSGGSIVLAGIDGGSPCTLTETQPAGYKSSANTAGTAGGTVGPLGGATEDIEAINLPTGADATGYLFGERKLIPMTITKIVAGDPNIVFNSATPFTFSVDCGADNVGGTPYAASIALTNANTGSTTVGDGTTGIASGASCSVTENAPLPTPNDVNYAWDATTTPPAARSVTLNASTPATNAVTVTNSLVRLTGSLVITKQIAGPAAGVSAASGTFDFTADCGADNLGGAPYTGSATVVAGAGSGLSAAIGPIPAGASCTVAEVTPVTAAPPTSYTWDATTPTSIATNPVVIPPGTSNVDGTATNRTGTATVTNTLDAQNGGLTITKILAGPSAGTSQVSGDFVFNADCGAAGQFPGTVTITGGAQNSVTIANVPAGASCTVTETSQATLPANSGYTWSATTVPLFTTNPVVIPANANGTITVTDTLDANAPATITVTKNIVGGPIPTSSVFTINVSCTQQAFIGSATITGAGSAAISGVPTPNTCTVGEGALPAAAANYDWDTSNTPPAALTVTLAAGGGASATVTNTEKRQSGALEIDKTVTGGPAAGVTASFSFSADCGPDNVGGVPYAATMAYTGTSGSVVSTSIASVPVGATCVITETMPTAASAPAGYVWGSTPAAVALMTTQAGPNKASFTNILNRNSSGLTINKTVTGTGGKGVSWTLNFSADCGVDNVGGMPFVASVALNNQTTGSTTIANVPAGASCTVSETAPTQLVKSTGYQWDGVRPAAVPVTIAADGSSHADFANNLTQFDPPFHLIKTIAGGPVAGVTGMFTFDIDCGALGTFTQTVTLGNATSGSVAISSLAQGANCTFSEVPSLPGAPPGFTWGTVPAAQSKTIDGTDVTFVNTLNSTAPPVQPTPVPALREWMLLLLGLLLLGTAAANRKNRNMRT